MDVDPDKAAWPIAVLTTLLGGGGLWAWLTARTKARTSPPAEMVTAAGDFAEAAAKVAEIFGDAGAGLVKALDGQLTVVRGEVAELSGRLDACEAKHHDCEARVAQMREEFDAYVRDNPPAEYRPADLQRPLG
jgi:hypothetical protein